MYNQAAIDAGIYTLYQPIVSLQTLEVLGMEALGRHALYDGPVELIRMARQADKLWPLEKAFRRSAIASMPKSNFPPLLFLNAEADLTEQEDFETGFTHGLITEKHLSPTRVVFEITERAAIDDPMNFVRILDHYRAQGYRIAIDDFGSGYAGLNRLAALRPDFVKLDMELIRSIDCMTYNQAIIKGIVAMADHVGLKLIAEGIETAAEFQTLMQLGVHYGQGYYIERPRPSGAFRDRTIYPPPQMVVSI